jgi:hypothetical protein
VVAVRSVLDDDEVREYAAALSPGTLTDWYESVLHLTPWLEFPDSTGVIRGVAYHPLGTLTLCLREDPARAAALAGFDLLAILVATRADLDDVTAHLDHLGVTHGPVTTATLGWLLNCRRPRRHPAALLHRRTPPTRLRPRRRHPRPAGLDRNGETYTASARAGSSALTS